MEELSLDNILTEGEIDNLFLEDTEDPQPDNDTGKKWRNQQKRLQKKLLRLM